ncbi:MAG: AmmeMemoRadiSam system radical SAM enzyme [Ignavibacteriales bacterium]|nr:AmmeMemoRadiSam system radical SAM enzyme [Ignavibacteriales bacterium]
MEANMISKREFLRRCAFCSAGIAFGLSGLEPLARAAVKVASPSLATDDLWKWSKEALFYRMVEGGLECQHCPNGCILAEGDTGICRSRVNYQGKLYSIAYGNPCAVHIDPIEKKPFFHFLPTTHAFSIAAAGCNFACLNCQNWEISQFSPKETQNYDLMPQRVVEECLKSKCESIAYTYSEPTTFYEYAFDTATLARKKGIKNVWKSNGSINEHPLRKLCKVMDAANIDLKSYDDDIYKKLSAGRLAPVLNTLKVFKEEGVWLEITNLIVPTWTDDLDMIKRMCDWLVKNGLHDCPLHFSRFNPLYKLTQLPVTPVSTLERAREIALKSGLQYVYIGNVPGHAAENTYCHHCSKMIVERRGFTILSNNIAGGTCKFCGAHIPGVWS